MADRRTGDSGAPVPGRVIRARLGERDPYEDSPGYSEVEIGIQVYLPRA